MKTFLAWVRDNPVVIMDTCKYLLAAVVLFGVPVPDGLDAIVAGLILAGLTVWTRALVTPAEKADAAIREALYTPVPLERRF